MKKSNTFRRSRKVRRSKLNRRRKTQRKVGGGDLKPGSTAQGQAQGQAAANTTREQAQRQGEGPRQANQQATTVAHPSTGRLQRQRRVNNHNGVQVDLNNPLGNQRAAQQPQ